MNIVTISRLISAVIIVSACSGEEPSTPPPITEFIAADADFNHYRAWEQTIEPRRGPDDAGMLKGAHNGDDTTMTRYVFINDGSAVRDASGNFPLGTRLVIEIRDVDENVAGITAMVKRGGGFNPQNREWEWFFLDSDGHIADRGDALMNGMCNGCHAARKSLDYVFTR